MSTSTHSPARSGQTRALFFAIGLDARVANLSDSEASDYLDRIDGGDHDAVIAELQERGATGTPKIPKAAREAAHLKLFTDAWAAGVEAAEAKVPVPMTVVEHANPLDDGSPIVRQYEPVSDGVCGFAWINVNPGNSSFARWLVKTGRGRASYRGGVDIWISDYNQSMEKKLAHAQGFANHLKTNGITKAYAFSRLD